LRQDPRRKLKDKQPKYISMPGSSYAMPYNADSLNKPCPAAFIIETELDALALMEALKMDSAIALPANQFTQQHAPLFWMVRSVYVVVDNDNAGMNAGKTIKALINRAKVVAPPYGYKELGEWMQEENRAYPDWILGANK